MRSQEAAIQWMLEQADRCPKCGTWPHEWDEDMHAYRAREYQCLGCLYLDNANETMRKQRKSTAGMHVDLVRRRDG